MKKTVLLIFVFLSLLTEAQNPETSKYALTTVNDATGMAVLNILDSYLSPLTYSGVGVFYEHSEQKLFSPDNTNLSMRGKIKVMAGITYNPQITAGIMYMGGYYNWGAFYHFRITNDFNVRVGSFIDAQFGFKESTRNENNPYSLDMATNLNLSALATYDIHLKKKVLRLNFDIETPVLGCMFVPQTGISYYELFSLNEFSNAVHFSSLHNKQGLTINTGIEIPFKYSTWKFGIETSGLKYKFNDAVFKLNEYNLIIGWKYNLYRFCGLKNAAPDNFISTYK